MATYNKGNFRASREDQYKHFLSILNYSILGIALVLIFLMIMVRFAWS